MDKKFFEERKILLIFIGTAVLFFLMLPLFVTVQAGDLPPRGGGDLPTPTPTPRVTPVAAAAVPAPGSRLQLHMTYGDNWAWESMAWQEVWTVVEWGDGQNWFVVEGWRGSLDSIDQQADGRWMSQKEWWVGVENLNTGPFRWVIYNREDGDVLATSEPFNLPARSGETMVIEQMVGE